MHEYMDICIYVCIANWYICTLVSLSVCLSLAVCPSVSLSVSVSYALLIGTRICTYMGAKMKSMTLATILLLVFRDRLCRSHLYLCCVPIDASRGVEDEVESKRRFYRRSLFI